MADIHLFILLLCGIHARDSALFWMLDNSAMSETRLQILQGDPEYLLTNTSAVVHDTIVWTWVNSFRPGKVAADHNLAEQFFVHDRHQGWIVHLEGFNVQSRRVIQIYKGATTMVKDLALDWIGQNIYYTDTQGIVLWSYKNGHYRTILDNLASPHGIDLDPIEGYLFWTDLDEQTISRSSLAGAGFQTVVLGLTGPRVITVDPVTRRLFWVNDGLNNLETADYNGNSRSVLIERNPDLFQGVEVYKNILFTQEREGKTIMTYFANGTRHRSVSIGRDGVYLQQGLFMASAVTQPATTHQCSVLNGGCEHICVPDTTRYICLCRFGYILNEDQTSCGSRYVTDDMLFVLDAEDKKLYQVVLETGEAYAITTSSLINEFKALTFDPADRKVYFSARSVRGDNAIHTATLGSSSTETVVYLGVGLSEALAIDPHDRILYYGDDIARTISSISLVTTERKTLITLDQDSTVKGIELDRINGHIYWSDVGTGEGNINRADILSGENRYTFVSTGVEAPYGLALDVLEGLLYWCDYALNKVERIHIDGTKREFITSTDASTCYDVAVDLTYVYVTSQHGIRRIDKASRKVTYLGQQVYWSMIGLNLFSSSLNTTAGFPRPSATTRPSDGQLTTRTVSDDITSTASPTEPSVTNASRSGLNLTIVIAISVCVATVVIIVVVVATVITVITKRRNSNVAVSAHTLSFTASVPEGSANTSHDPVDDETRSPRVSVHLYEEIPDNVVDQYIITHFREQLPSTPSEQAKNSGTFPDDN